MKHVYTFADLQSWETVTAGEHPPLRLGVFGDPVAHSASPPMHNAALEACGIDARYCRLHIHPHELTDALRLLPRKGFIGVNCTIPHKAGVLATVDEADEAAHRAGGVNTVIVAPDGRLHGASTDGPGLTRAVREQLGVEFRDLRVLILGAGGGAGRAVAMQCATEGCPRLALTNRTREKLDDLATALRAVYPPQQLVVDSSEPAALAAQLAETDLVINCSALGMEPGDPSPVPAALLRSHHLIYDTIYTADRTPLMRAGDAAGARSANGLAMLLHQGVLSFEKWFHRAAPVEVMRTALQTHATQR